MVKRARRFEHTYTIRMEDTQHEALKKLAERLGCSMASMIKRGIDMALAEAGEKYELWEKHQLVREEDDD